LRLEVPETPASRPVAGVLLRRHARPFQCSTSVGAAARLDLPPIAQASEGEATKTSASAARGALGDLTVRHASLQGFAPGLETAATPAARSATSATTSAPTLARRRMRRASRINGVQQRTADFAIGPAVP
jgi:hypothetical protein